MNRLLPSDAFWARAATPTGQLTGLVLLCVPAVTNPIRLVAVAHAIVQTLAVVAGFVGALMVFGGLARKVLLRDRELDEVLVEIPNGRALWWAMIGLVVLLAVGAEWRLVLIFTDEWSTHLPEVVLLVLPAVALGVLAWRTRALRQTSALVDADDIP